MEIKVGELDVYHSGSIVLNGENSLSFSLFGMNIEFKFVNTEDGKQSVNAQKIDKEKLFLEFYNFKNSLGSGQLTPIKMATLNNGKELYLQYCIYGIGENLKVVHHTWYTKTLVASDLQNNVEGK